MQGVYRTEEHAYQKYKQVLGYAKQTDRRGTSYTDIVGKLAFSESRTCL